METFLYYNPIKSEVMLRTNDIYQLNEANLILRHFVDLSAKLLPFLNELENKKSLSASEQLDKQKIIDVFVSYQFDTKTSETLIGSNILELIQKTFENIIFSKKLNKRTEQKLLRNFLLEHKRLSDNWEQIDAN